MAIDLKKPKIQKFLSLCGFQAFSLPNFAARFSFNILGAMAASATAHMLGYNSSVWYSFFGAFLAGAGFDISQAFVRKDQRFRLGTALHVENNYLHKFYQILESVERTQRFDWMDTAKQQNFLNQKKAQFFILNKELVSKEGHEGRFADIHKNLFDLWAQKNNLVYPSFHAELEQPRSFLEPKNLASKAARNRMAYFRYTIPELSQDVEFKNSLYQELQAQNIGVLELTYDLAQASALYKKTHPGSKARMGCAPAFDTILELAKICFEKGEKLTEQQTKEMLGWLQKTKNPLLVREYLSGILDSLHSIEQLGFQSVDYFTRNPQFKDEPVDFFQNERQKILSLQQSYVQLGLQQKDTHDFSGNLNNSAPNKINTSFFKPGLIEELSPDNRARIFNTLTQPANSTKEVELNLKHHISQADKVFNQIYDKLQLIETQTQVLTLTQQMEIKTLVNNHVPSLLFHAKKLVILEPHTQIEHLQKLSQTAQLMLDNIQSFQADMGRNLGMDLEALHLQMKNKKSQTQSVGKVGEFSSLSHVNHESTLPLENQHKKTLKAKH